MYMRFFFVVFVFNTFDHLVICWSFGLANLLTLTLLVISNAVYNTLGGW